MKTILRFSIHLLLAIFTIKPCFYLLQYVSSQYNSFSKNILFKSYNFSSSFTNLIVYLKLTYIANIEWCISGDVLTPGITFSPQIS